MKKLTSIILCIVLILTFVCFTACGENEYTPADMTVACMTGPTGVGMAKLMALSAEKNTDNNYTFTVAAAATEINPKFINGEINIASVPTNVAATLYNKTEGKVRILAVNTYGVLSILEKGDTIKSIADLKGKKIYSTGKGQNPEFILKYILEKNGLTMGTDVTVEFVSSEDLVQKLVSGEAEVALAPEPAATTVMVKNTALRRALSINDEWSNVSDTKLMMGCVIALDSYVKENTAAVEKFLEEYQKSIEFATTNVDEAAKHCATYKITASEAIAKKAIPTCNLCFVKGSEMKTNVNGYFDVLFKADPKSIGGEMPADDFYYEAN
jgi:NitT/TauT family transport system substrate-binding protein